MSLPSTRLRSSAGALLLCITSASLPACLACNDIGCGGGFEWEGRDEDGIAVAPGSYGVALTLESNRFELACDVGATFGQSDCGEPEQVEGGANMAITFALIQQDGEDDWDPEKPVAGFRLYAADVSDSDPDGVFSATRGPTSVRIQITGPEEGLVDAEFEQSYQRDKEYRGHEDCGYCDSLQERKTAW